VGAPLRALTLLSVLVVLLFGLNWRRADLERRALEREVEAAAKAVSAPSTSPPAAAAAGAAAAAPRAPLPPARAEPVRRATDDELAVAVAAGVDGLLPLSEKYPKDPRVLERLLVSFATFASRATGYADAMSVAKRLIAVAPEYMRSEALGHIVRRAAETPGNASTSAFELMSGPLGSIGPDLLYQLSLSDAKGDGRARALLATPAVQALATPALRVALDVRAAAGCEAVPALLPRARALGDQRTAALLAGLAQGSKSGCGKWKRSPCVAQCKDQSKEILDVVRIIQLRGKTTEL
jgi:hypothetical protein